MSNGLRCGVAVVLSVGLGLLAAPSGLAVNPVRDASAIGPNVVHVEGNHLVDGDGDVVLLVGLNRSGSEYACAQGWGIFDGPVDGPSIAAMKTWKPQIVRVPLNEDCWLGINGV